MKKATLTQELLNDLLSPKLMPAITSGIVNGVLLVIVATSFAAMIFSGELAPFAIRAAGLTLFGTLAIGIINTLFSEFKTNIPVCQDAPAATLTMAIPAAAVLLPFSEEAAFMTMIGILFLSTLTTGITFLVIGHFKLANLFRFIPYPVIGGFLAGSGWVLIIGGISVMCGLSPSLNNLATFLTPELIAKWLPGILFGGGLFIVMLRWSHFLLLPCALIGGACCYYLVFAIFNINIEHAKEMGFLVSSIPENGLWPVFDVQSLSHVRWDVVLQNIPTALTVALVSTICLLLNTGGVELACAEDLDMNNEFKMTGFGNILASIGGSSPGCIALSLSTLGNRTGANTRLGGIITYSIVGTVLFFGGGILGFFPKPLLGALLLFLGLFFIWDWVIATYTRMPRLDYMLIIGIMAVIVRYGFLAGVAAGIGATVIIFVIRFSRVSVIRKESNLADNHSLKHRSPPDRNILLDQGQYCTIYELSGYLFFGSASSLIEKLKADITETTKAVILDLQHVSGFDISAISNFQRLLQMTNNLAIQLYFSHSPKNFEFALSDSALGNLVPIFATNLNQALEKSEEMLIRDAQKILDRDSGQARDELFERSVDDVMAMLERLELFETITERVTPWGDQLSFSSGEKLAEIGQPTKGLLLLISGSVTEMDSHGVPQRNLTVGTPLHPESQFRTTMAKFNIIADSRIEVLILTPENRNSLEAESPMLALQLDRYIMENGEA